MSEEKNTCGNEEMTVVAPEKKKKKKKKWVKKTLVLFFLAGIIGIFIFGLISAMNGNDYGSSILASTGVPELIIAFIGVKVLLSREKKICPECGTKRVHHRKWVRTSEQYKNYQDLAKIIYTHEYIDSWVCPECGETMTEKVKKSGGELIEYSTGRIQDNRRSPSEF